MKKSPARFTVILASALFLVAVCADTNKHDQARRRLDPQNVNLQNTNSQNTNSTDTVSVPALQNDGIEVEEKDECHDPDCSPVAGEGVILFPDDGCRLHAVDAKTGKRKWLSEKG